MTEKPLNPLSEHALSCLRTIRDRKTRGYKINPGVRRRLYGEGLIEQRWTMTTDWLEITEAGRAVLDNEDGKC